MRVLSVNGIPAPKPVGPRTTKAAVAWERYRAYKLSIQYAANPKWTAGPWTGPIELSVRFYMPMPRRLRHDKPSLTQAARGRLLPTGKPDLKNLLAAVEDSLTRIAWVDDAQVVAYGYLLKTYTAENKPRTMIMVRELTRGLEVQGPDRMRKLYTGVPGQDLVNDGSP